MLLINLYDLYLSKFASNYLGLTSLRSLFSLNNPEGFILLSQKRPISPEVIPQIVVIKNSIHQIFDIIEEMKKYLGINYLEKYFGRKVERYKFLMDIPINIPQELRKSVEIITNAYFNLVKLEIPKNFRRLGNIRYVEKIELDERYPDEIVKSFFYSTKSKRLSFFG